VNSTSAEQPKRSLASVVAFTAFISALLAVGIDTALPAFDEIRSAFDLGRGSGQVSLVVTCYFLGMAIGQLPSGPLSDRFGRRPVLIGSLVLYAIGALGSSLAPGFGLLLVFRFLWGIGAAGPAVIAQAIARDLYEGDQMARVLALQMAVFLVGPTIAPLAGELLLRAGPWQLVFLVALALSGVGIAWSARFGETLPSHRRRPIDGPTIGRGIRATLTHRYSTGCVAAMVFSFGAFFVFLGSSQPIVDEVYGRPEWFAFTFAGISAVQGVGVWLSSRVLGRYSAATVGTTAVAVNLVAYLVMGTAALATSGVPSFWVWVVTITVASTASTITTITLVSLSLQPMERIAGTATAVRGLLTLGFGSVLAAVVDRQIDMTITPMAIGGAIYCTLAFVVLTWARSGSLAVIDPDRR